MTTTKTKKRVELPPNPFLHEILELTSKQRAKAKKVEVLQQYENDALKSIFIWNFDETVISLVPEGEVPYADGNDQSELEPYLKIYHGKQRVANLQQDKILMVEVKLLCVENIKISITL